MVSPSDDRDPFLAAGLTAWLTLRWQDRKEKRDFKLRTFASLMAVRGNFTDFNAVQEWNRSLQLIPVAFADCPNVPEKWRNLHQMLQHQEKQPGQDHALVELYFAMAGDLGLSLQQLDIEKTHLAQGIAGPIARANEVQDELLRVLKKTDSLIVQPKSVPATAPGSAVPTRH